jgi:lipopolysaccharide/colanic/teichoic acid biosynthesis glycosyltransferase
MQEGLDLDLEYVQRRSFWLDLRILIKTIPAVFTADGAP